MAENERYVESILIRLDNVELPEGNDPTFNDGQVDKIFEFEGTVKLIQIVKNVSNATHNTHSYIFKIENIEKLTEQGD